MSPRNRAGRHIANERGAFEQGGKPTQTRPADETKRVPLRPPLKPELKPNRWIN